MEAAYSGEFFEELGQVGQGVEGARIAVGDLHDDGDGGELHFAQNVAEAVGPERFIGDRAFEFERTKGAKRIGKRLSCGQESVGVGQAVRRVLPGGREHEQGPFG